ncbi:MAG: DUF6438 domain-containing protein [Chitinophagaceae bacterium]
MIKSQYLYIMLWLMLALLFSCNAQSGDNLRLSKIIFHSSRCNGICPQIDLEIDSAKNIYVNREYFKTKSLTDERFSGQFKGVLSQTEYNKLLEILKSSNINELKFPNSDIMDVAETTIIVYYNGQRKYLKSSEPPDEAKGLIQFLTLLSDNKTLERTAEIRSLEN